MGCQRQIAKQVTGQGADYIFGLKGNQGGLRDGVVALFGSAATINEAEQQGDLQKHLHEEALGGGHGRIEGVGVGGLVECQPQVATVPHLRPARPRVPSRPPRGWRSAPPAP